MKKLILVILTVFMVLTLLFACAAEQESTSDFVSALSGNGIDSQTETGENASSQPEEDSISEAKLDVGSYFAEVRKENRTDCYIIDTAEQLYNFAMLVNTHQHDFENELVLLRTDIELNPTHNVDEWQENPPENVWVPIGSAEYPFKGEFSGGYFSDDGSLQQENRTISGIYCPASEGDAALFGYVKSDGLYSLKEGVISNITLGKGYIGTPKADAVHSAGGITKMLSSCIINKCANYGEVNGGVYAGGISASGVSDDICSINSCVNLGSIFAGECAGGIIGGVDADTTVLTMFDVLNMGKVSNMLSVSDDMSEFSRSAGGIVGNMRALSWDGVGDVVIRCALNVGDVDGIDIEDAIVPDWDDEDALINCYYLESSADSAVHGNGLSKAEMSDENAFDDINFWDNWYIDKELGHPYIYGCGRK